ncbi:DNA polymerase delta subunit 2 [Halictus rubicundus]|uniref:DNA polymerase delta subunit 2 n=1 Tax=Halictus rubicundus TaxID=77578 RepID=UPI004035FBF9
MANLFQNLSDDVASEITTVLYRSSDKVHVFGELNKRTLIRSIYIYIFCVTMIHKINGSANNLLVKPDDGKPQVFERKQAEYTNLSRKFINTRNDYSKQFAHIYSTRLAELRDVLIPQVKAKWGIPIMKLADLESLDGQECVIIGTLYKHQQWKPSILREFSDEYQLSAPCARLNYCSEKDVPYLEDEMLRIKLEGEHVHLKDIVTGVVCAVWGNENSNGAFTVKDWCFPGCAPKKPITDRPSSGKLMLVSGLDLSRNHENLAMSLFVDWLTGMAGNIRTQKDGTSIVRLIIAGNTMTGSSATPSETNTLDKEIETIKIMDTFLSDLAKCCAITLMPGEHDPTNAMLPQKPLHPCLLPKTFRLESFKSTTNPWIGRVEGRQVVGNSGQSIEDIIKASGETDISTIEWLERTLLWRHMCPTAPDTLSACPYYKEDLFIMKECPDIYFVGNSEKYETKLWKGNENQVVRLISVPRFSTTHTAVIVDLENLDTQCISFSNA